MDHVFISYSAMDRALAKRLSDGLRGVNVPTRSALDILPGTDWYAEVVSALGCASAVIVIVTPRSLKSDWVAVEWSKALRASKRVIAVLADGIGSESLPRDLRRGRSISLPTHAAPSDGSCKRDYSESDIAAIAEAVRELSRSEPPPSALVDVNATAKHAAGQELLGLGVENVESRPVVRSQPQLVFVLTSFEEDMRHSTEAIKRAATGVGLSARIAKDDIGDDRVLDSILSSVKEAGLIVADLTHGRPNVYFELGFARGLGKTVVTIAREGTELHFNVRDYRCLWYADSRQLEEDLIRRFQFELERRQEGSGHISDTPTARTSP